MGVFEKKQLCSPRMESINTELSLELGMSDTARKRSESLLVQIGSQPATFPDGQWLRDKLYTVINELIVSLIKSEMML